MPRLAVHAAPIALLIPLALAACAPAAPPEAAAPQPEAAAITPDYTLERKPQPGDPASAVITDDKLALRVFGDDGSISEAVILLNPSAPPPPGMTKALGLEGENWELHPVTVEKLADKDRNGLCSGAAPTFVLKRKDAEEAFTFVGFTGQTVTETDPANLCSSYRFRP
jgi:hypothetical protein